MADAPLAKKAKTGDSLRAAGTPRLASRLHHGVEEAETAAFFYCLKNSFLSPARYSRILPQSEAPIMPRAEAHQLRLAQTCTWWRARPLNSA